MAILVGIWNARIVSKKQTMEALTDEVLERNKDFFRTQLETV